MKKYYLWSECADTTIIGNSVPQCWHFIKKITADSKEDFYITDRAFMNGDIQKLIQLQPLYGIRMDRRAKITDFLSCIVPRFPIVNHRVLNLFQEYNAGKYFTLPITIIRNKEELLYFCYCCLNRFTEYVDFPKSIFRKQEGKITGINNLEEYKKLGYPDPIEIHIKKESIPYVDIFVLPGITYGPNFFISEELAKRLEDDNFTGQEINKDIIAIAD